MKSRLAVLARNTRPRKTLGWRTPAKAPDEKLRSLHEEGIATSACIRHLDGSLELTVILPEGLHLRRIVGADTRRGALVDIGLTHPGPHGLGDVAELGRDALHRAVIGTQPAVS